MKQFYVGGFFYNSSSKKVLLHRRGNKTDNTPGLWSFFGALSAKGETPQEVLQRAIHEALHTRVPLKAIVPLYDYFNDDIDAHRHVFFLLSKYIKEKPKAVEGEEVAWIPMEEVMKRKLSKRTRQDLTFFQRELAARVRELLPPPPPHPSAE